MQDREFADQKLRSAIQLADSLLAGDWPHRDSEDALKRIRKLLQGKLDDLIKLDDGANIEVIKSHCKEARSSISQYMGFLGFILRSSNVRNAFEIYEPLCRLGKELLGEDLRIVVGSEWNYIPFIYPTPAELLSDYIFVGLPASEGQNALLVPIAGHELGHAVWRRTPLKRFFSKMIQEGIVSRIQNDWPNFKELFSNFTSEQIGEDLVARTIWGKSYEFSERQCEEIFSDVLALWIFGEGFIHAFRYLLFPNQGVRASNFYPSNGSRAEFITKASGGFGDKTAYSLIDLFPKEEISKDKLLTLADETTRQLVPDIIAQVRAHCEEKKIKRPTPEGKEAARRSLWEIKPTKNHDTIADIINAAWEIRLKVREWEIVGVKEARKLYILNDLVFKSFEGVEVPQEGLVPKEGLIVQWCSIQLNSRDGCSSKLMRSTCQ